MRRATSPKAVIRNSRPPEFITVPQRSMRFRPAVLALSMAAAFASLPTASQNVLPVFKGNVTGTADAVRNAAGTQMVVTTTNGAGKNFSSTNWSSFSVGAANGVRINQPGAASLSINRVVDPGNPSQILGTLSSNGKLVLVNPSGITVGANALVDTAGFTASVLGMNDADAAAGRLRFNSDGLGQSNGSLQVHGNVIARGGDVVLIAPNIEVAKTSVVEAQGGAVLLAAGQKVEVTGRGLEGIVMQVQAPADQAVNLGTLRGDAVGIFAGTLRHSGLIQARGVSMDSGKVVLRAGDVAEVTGKIEAQRVAASGSNGGDVAISARYAAITGAIDASGQVGGTVAIDATAVLQAAPITVAGVTAGGTVLVRGAQSVIQTAETVINADATQGSGGAVVVQANSGEGSGGTVLTSATLSAGGTTGGTVKVLGSSIRLQGAQIAADGDMSGGTLLVGGNRHGNDPLVPNSQYLYVNSATALSARSRRAGAGGNVVLWSDGTTRFFGSVDARGAGAGSQGGFVEVSGKDALQFGGTVTASGGPGGANGTLLLDPKNLTIGAAPGQLGVIELADPNSEAGGAGDFGNYILNLGSNRVVVTDPYDTAGGTNAGAIYVYDKTSGALLSALTGSHNNDSIGASYQNATGAIVFRAASWNGGVGAYTWLNNGTGASLPASGIVSSANSLVGTAVNDLLGASLSTTTGRDLLIASNYGGGAGAVATFTPSGLTGTLDSTNALVGTAGSADALGSGGVRQVSGNYYLMSPNWSGNTGAITVLDTTQALSGTISTANSLTGSATGDRVGNSTSIIRQLGNGRVMVFSAQWGMGKGAFSMFDSASLVKGSVTDTNSLVGSTTSDGAGFFIQNCSVTNFCNTSVSSTDAYFLVTSTTWNANSGSVTFLSQDTPAASSPTGTLSSANSLVGAAGDRIGSGGFTITSAGYVSVLSPSFGSGSGAVTFGAVSAGVGPKGLVGAGNSIVGTAVGDFTDATVRTDFTSGKLLLVAPTYGGGAGALALLNAGAAGTLDASNALVGSVSTDRVGSAGIINDGNFWILGSPSWNGTRGAFTVLTPGSATIATGFVSGAANSWVGSNIGDQVGAGFVFTQFANNNAVVVNRRFGSGSATALTGPGAITLIQNPGTSFGTISSANSWLGTLATDGAGITVRRYASSGAQAFGTATTNSIVLFNEAWNDYRGFVTLINQSSTGLSNPGFISGANSLVGAVGGGISAGDRVGFNVGAIDGNTTATLLVRSPYWHAGGTLANAGGYTFGNLATGVMPTGVMSGANSLVGTGAGDLGLGSANLYSANLTGSGAAYLYTVDGDHALLVAPDYAGGKGAIVNINLASPLTGTLTPGNALMGGTTTDHIGSGGVFEQYQYRYQTGGMRVLVASPSLNSSAGALTSIDTAAASPVGAINGGNSFVGATAGDLVGNDLYGNVREFANGKLLVVTPEYTADGSISSAGALTVLGGNAVTGTIDPSNSLVGSSSGDFSNFGLLFHDASGYTGYGNYVFVNLLNWSNTTAGTSNSGAIVKLDATATAAPTGTISSANALVGTHDNDIVGGGSIDVQSDGVGIYTATWNNGNGLFTFTGLTTALTGNADAPTSAGTSSVLGDGSQALDGYNLIYGSPGKRTLIAPNYSDGKGAIFNVDIAAGFSSGVLTSTNAMIGASIGDHIGSGGYTYWGNGGYLVGSPEWNNATGAITLSGLNGQFATGVVGAGNSLVGAQANDRVGEDVFSSNNHVSLDNGKLVLINRQWGTGAGTTGSGLGAITLLQNPAQFSGVIDASNSLLGKVAGDGAGFYVQTIYATGTTNRVLVSNQYYNGNRGMVTYVDGTLGTSPHGTIDETNSLVGSSANDRVGQFVELDFYNNSAITIRSPGWSGGTGAVTSSSLTGLPVGFVGAGNSLVGAQAGDQFGSANAIFNYSDGFYRVMTTSLAGNVGGVTFYQRGATGVLSAANTVYGSATGGFISSAQETASTYRITFTAGSGRVVYANPGALGAGGAGSAGGSASSQTFGDAPGSDVTVTPQAITSLLEQGTNLTLQANNDIFVNAAVNTNSNFNSGSLLLQAGRSIAVNADISLYGGSLALYANHPDAMQAYRDAGLGGISMAAGANIYLNGGDMLAVVGAGANGGGINLGNVLYGETLLALNYGTGAGAGISQNAGTVWDVQNLGLQTSSLSGHIGTLSQPVAFSGQLLAVKTANGDANIHALGPMLLVASDPPDSGSVGSSGNGQTSSPPSPVESDPSFRGISLGGNGSLNLKADGSVYLQSSESRVAIEANDLVIEAPNGSVYVSAYGAPVEIHARGTLQVRAGQDFFIHGGEGAGAFASVMSAGRADIVAGGTLDIHGGSGAGAYALLDPTQPGSTMFISAPNLTLTGGTGANSYAGIISAGGPLTLDVDHLTMTPGAGPNADAFILAPNAEQLAMGSGFGYLGTNDPRSNAVSDSGFGTVLVAVNDTLTAQFLADQDILSNFLNNYNDELLRQRRRGNRGDIVLEETCK